MAKYIIKTNGKKLKTNKLDLGVGKGTELSVVIPTFNEEKNIEEIVKDLKKVIDKLNLNYEIVVVDDNSSDKTGEIIDRFANEDNFIAVHRLKNKGIGSAVIDGIKISRGDYVLTMDSDFSHPPEKIPEILKYKQDYDIVIGSRFIEGGDMEGPFTRKYGSKILNRVCGIIMGLKVRDLGGNFRLFNKGKFSELKIEYESIFGEFGFEILYRAKKRGYKVKEVPFVYKFRKEGNSKMKNLFYFGICYLKRALELRFG